MDRGLSLFALGGGFRGGWALEFSVCAGETRVEGWFVGSDRDRTGGGEALRERGQVTVDGGGWG